MSYSVTISNYSEAFLRDVTRQCTWKMHRRESKTARKKLRYAEILVASAVVTLYYAGAAE